MLKFDLREPIGSSTYPMPDNAVDYPRTMSALDQPPAADKTASTLYIHIPFCDQICSFCSFNKSVSSEDTKSQYVKALLKEMEAYGRKRHVQNLKIDAVYLGGGTPNSLSPGDLTKVLSGLHTHFPLTKDCEITCEGTPQNFTPERNQALLAGGVNRVSAGIQTFDKSIRIAHLHMNDGKDDLLRYVEGIKRDFKNFNLDMIYNLPKQTDAIWQDDLATAIAMGSKHLTIYPLVLLEKTIFYTDYVKNGVHAPPDQDREIELFNWSLQKMSGSEFTTYYSVRDWAKPGHESRYIRMNAECNQIVALGAGAHGYLAGQTYRNVRATNKYIASLLQDDALPLEAQRFCTAEEEMQRYMVMGLRLNAFDTAPFEQKFGKPLAEVFGDKVETIVQSGYMTREDSKLHHTHEGLIWGNNLRTYFEGSKGTSVGYTDTTSIGETGKDHYSKITRIKAAGDVEANVDEIRPIHKLGGKTPGRLDNG